jgi:PAS domain S-box-containing protein
MSHLTEFEIVKNNPAKTIQEQLDYAFSKIMVLETILEDLTIELNKERILLDHSNQDLTMVLENMANVLIATDKNFGIRIANRSTSNVLGYEPEEIMGTSIDKLFHYPWLIDAVNKNHFDNSNTVEKEELFYNPESGETLSILMSCSLIQGDSSPEGIVCICSDITKRKKLEQDLLQSQKLESIGTLAAGIAHELNTPIQYVRDNTVFLTDEFPGVVSYINKCNETLGKISENNSEFTKIKDLLNLKNKLDLDYLVEQIPLALNQTKEGAEAVAKIVKSMKEFSHPGTDVKQAINLNAAIQSTTTVSKNEWKYLATLDFDLDSSLPPLLCYPGELNQVMLNLIVNAAHAIEEKRNKNSLEELGQIKITTKYIDNNAVITISDTGTGIPESILSMIFDPFFTTKSVGKGTGQGLTLARRIIVERHGGTLSVDSKENIGTVFTITLPISN